MTGSFLHPVTMRRSFFIRSHGPAATKDIRWAAGMAESRTGAGGREVRVDPAETYPVLRSAGMRVRGGGPDRRDMGRSGSQSLRWSEDPCEARALLLWRRQKNQIGIWPSSRARS